MGEKGEEGMNLNCKRMMEEEYALWEKENNKKHREAKRKSSAQASQDQAASSEKMARELDLVKEV